MERKLATIRRIDKLEPIEGADKILKATIGGWQLVTAKDNGFKEGDLVVYLEVDSWVPYELAPFLSKGKEPREFNGVKGERLRTIKLRGQISQGLILPIDSIKYTSEKDRWNVLKGDGPVTDLLADVLFTLGKEKGELEILEFDLTELLGIQKWEKPIPTQLQGVCRSNFPSICPKTDQERIQNLSRELDQWIADETGWEITEKLEGSSMTVLADTFEDSEYNQTIVDVHVCSRNMDLKLDQEGNAFVDTAKKTGLIDAITRYVGLGFGRIAVQGELVGPGIQGNIYKLPELRFFVYDIWDIEHQEYFDVDHRHKIVDTLKKLGADIDHVPLLAYSAELWDTLGLKSVSDVLGFAEGKSLLADTEREGLVFKSYNGTKSFKAISNKYLMNEED